MKHGFIKVAAAAPETRVADPMFNADAVIRAMDEHARLGVKVLVFPELTLTGATCGDLFYQNTLLAGAAAALEKVVKASEGKGMLVFVGLPVAQGAKVYDAAAAVCNGELLGVVPASCPGDKHFALPGALLDDIQIGSLGPVDFHLQQLFQQFIRLKNLLPGIQTHVQCHLIISASSGMQFLSGISQTVNKVCFHKTVNILIFRSDGKLSALHIRKNFL